MSSGPCILEAESPESLVERLVVVARFQLEVIFALWGGCEEEGEQTSLKIFFFDSTSGTKSESSDPFVTAI